MKSLYKRSILLSYYACLLSASTSRAFLIQFDITMSSVASRRHGIFSDRSRLHEARSEDDQESKKQKKRRFAQQVHQENITSQKSLSEDQTRNSKFSEKQSDTKKRSTNSLDNGENSKQIPRNRSNERPFPSQPIRSQGISKNNMLKWSDNLSIEDLEARLSKRWKSAPNQNVKGTLGVMKSKPVLDPWSTEIGVGNNDYAGLQRVKRFQEKFKVGSGSSEIEVSLGQDEYYDNDDIEVEGLDEEDSDVSGETDDDELSDDGAEESDDGRYINNDSEWNLADLISSNPAGRHENDVLQSSNTKVSERDSETAGGFFFRQAATEVMKNSEKRTLLIGNLSESAQQLEKDNLTKAQVTKPSAKADIAPALLDENGKEQYLTLQLALQQLKQVNDSSDKKAPWDNGAENVGSEKNENNQDFLDEEGETAFNDIICEDKKNKVDIEKIQSFSNLGISDETILANLDGMGCSTPLPVQSGSCHPALQGQDIVIATHTGSGKSLAFLVPLVQKIIHRKNAINREDDKQQSPSGIEIVDDKDVANLHTPSHTSSYQHLQVIIVAPGRELASQIVTVARELLIGTNINVALAIGGTPFQRCYDTIRKKKPAILIGTPGRIAELIVGREGEKSGKVKLSHCHSLVFDEFDALLQYAVHRDPTMAIWNTVSKLHAQRKMQTILCSATAADFKEEKLSQFLHPDYIRVSTGETAEMMTQGNKVRLSLTTIHSVLHLDHRRFAIETIRKILHTSPTPQQVLIFVNNARRVSIVVDKLQENGIIAAPLYGGSEKNDRTDVCKALRDGNVGCVVVSAQGVD